eukprot:1825766-Pyramimonas_sp.AAC.1
MSNMRAILILEQGREKVINPGVEMHKVLVGEGARILNRRKTPSGHLAFEAGEYEMATEDQGSMSFIITASPQCEEAPLFVKEVSDPEPISGAPAVNDAHAYMMSQDTKSISFSINDETLTFAIQTLVNNTLKTWH